MKILFVYPGIARFGFNSYKDDLSGDQMTFAFPMGICYLAASAMEAGHEPALLDLRRLEGFGDVEKKIGESGADVVALSFQSPDRDFGFETAKIAKRLGKKVIVGGLHASMQSKECMDSGLFDTVFTGPGELNIVKFLDLVEKGEVPPKLMAGENPKDLDTLPFPHIFPEYEYVVRKLKLATILITRGCYSKCTYCYPASEKAFGRKIRMRSMANVKKEVESHIDRHGINRLLVIDDLFLANRKKTEEFTTMVKELGNLDYIINTRAELLNGHNMPLLKENVSQIFIGFESGSQRILDLIKKQTTVEKNLNAGHLLKKHGVGFTVNILTGIPGETREDYELTMNMLRKIEPENVYYNCLSPLPGTAIHDYCKENGLLPDNFPYEWYEAHTMQEKRLIKSVDYDLVDEYMDKVHELIFSLRVERGFEKFSRKNENLKMIDQLKKMENKNVFILRSGPVWLLNILLNALEGIVKPQDITVLTPKGPDLSRFKNLNIRYLKNKIIGLKSFKEQAEVFSGVTEKKYGAAFILYGGMERKTYAEPEKLFGKIDAGRAFELNTSYEIKEIL